MGLLSLFKRSVKGSKLTSAELDQNWTDIENVFPNPTGNANKAIIINAGANGLDLLDLTNPLSVANLFTADGTLQNNRNVELDGNAIIFINSSFGFSGFGYSPAPGSNVPAQYLMIHQLGDVIATSNVLENNELGNEHLSSAVGLKNNVTQRTQGFSNKYYPGAGIYQTYIHLNVFGAAIYFAVRDGEGFVISPYNFDGVTYTDPWSGATVWKVEDTNGVSQFEITPAGIKRFKLQEFDDDSAAIAGGLNIGDEYRLSATNTYSLPAGLHKTIV
ncbi:MAG: hypothetical protein K1X55_17465 [Chitinophagales bacterium]|nr:hypothetical protein [Chitinophagales bacterium]